MSHCVVRLNGTEEVEEFVKAASKCDFDIDIFYNRVIIDAKSILGILSMDLNRDLTVHCYGDSPAEICCSINFIKGNEKNSACAASESRDRICAGDFLKKN